MRKTAIVYEIPTNQDYVFLKRYVRKNIPVWIIEPFYAYHHKKGRGLFPTDLPSFVKKLISEGKISVLKAEDIGAKEIYFLSVDKAVETVNAVYSEYRKKYEELFVFIVNILKSPLSENVFKKNLCDRLAEFYSVNIMIHNVEKNLPKGHILVYPEMNVRSYLYIKKLLSKCTQDYYEHPNIRFPIKTQITALSENLKEYLVTLVKLSAQTVVSRLLGSFKISHKKERKNYSYGVAVVSPTRQLTDNQRGPGFIIDNNKINAEDVVYFPLVNLRENQKKQLAEIPGSVYYLPKPGRLFSHFNEWRNMLWLALKNNPLRSGREISIASNALFNYFRWKKVMEDVGIKHFITHCDFSIEQIGRNIALNQAGVQTWYFTDSMNHGCNWKVENEKCGMRLPFWTYLSYDHLVTWNELLDQYFKDHPGSFKQIHVVGCLWSEHIKKENNSKNKGDKFTLAAFDTTYSVNSFTSYAEGVAFAEHLLRLADDHSDICIFLKEKKQREIHSSLDPVLGPKLLDLYEKMSTHPRITICSDREDSSELISFSDMVISFPFTSTTFEALSVNKPAVWHDPFGYYRDTPYAKVDGVTTHSYEELKEKVLEIKNMKPGTYQNPIETGSPLMDPYRDGKAIDRFRELLISFSEKPKT